MDNIIWKDIIINGVITDYEVNNIGQVRNKTTDKILKPELNDHGYLRIGIFCNKKRYFKGIHRLVATAFIPNPDNKPQVNHIDGNKLNNKVENLEWCTNSENIKHAYRIGLKHAPSGSNHPMHKCNDYQIHLICKMLEKNIPMKLISKFFKINYHTIRNIRYGYNWNSISKLYRIPNNDTHPKIKYSKLKKILLELNMFNKINLCDLLYSKYITHKKKLIEDLELLGYEIFLYKYEIDKIYGIQNK